MIAGGGTGGHAIPALCVADELKRRGVAVEFLGAASGIEAELVPAAGYRLHALPLRGLSDGPAGAARAGLLFARALGRFRRLIRDFRPAALLGVGGYASAPAVVAARTLGVPTFLHEQNSVPGKVNRFAARFTEKILVTFPEAAGHFPRAIRVGMPTRPEFFAVRREAAREHLGLEPPVVLVYGGSGGALKLNTATVEAFGSGETPYSIVQVAGRRDYPGLKTSNLRHRILEYEPEIWHAVGAADVVVSRAGAGSLFDLAAVGRAAILVPFPHAAGDHQLKNARYFTVRGAAELMLDSEVTAGALRGRVEELLRDTARRRKLESRIRGLATPEAAAEVADRLLRSASGEKEQR
jgi:UDP-N-acetylglucosamine--N-acetylmuramyl-(pentapeptide) pyrophosphoryl-undecaprenol N-acetylglucosamine transferase